MCVCARSLTETVEAEGSVVKEVADVARLRGHGAEGVRTAGGEGVHADEQHVHQQGPGVAVRQEVQGGAEDGETPQEVPANKHNLVFLHSGGTLTEFWALRVLFQCRNNLTTLGHTILLTNKQAFVFNDD